MINRIVSSLSYNLHSNPVGPWIGYRNVSLTTIKYIWYNLEWNQVPWLSLNNKVQSTVSNSIAFIIDVEGCFTQLSV